MTFAVLALAAGGALLVAVVLPLGVRPVLVAWGALDVPVARSSHQIPTLRGGGIAVAGGLLVGLGVLAAGADGVARSLVLTILTISAVTAVVGLVEDVRGLSTRTRAGLQLALGIVVAVVVSHLTDLPWWLAVVGAVFFAGYVNVANFMDGINGISSLHGVVVGLGYALLGALSDVPWLIGVGLCLAASFIAFLPWNLRSPGMFLGDSGSYLLGASIAVTAVAAVGVGVPLVAVVAPLVPYLADTGTTLVRRVRRGEVWHEAHRSHAYQRLALTLGHVPVAVLVSVASAAAVGLATLTYLGGPAVVAAWAGLALLAVLYLASPTLATTLGRKTEGARRA